MKLYELNKNQKFTIGNGKQIFTFHNIDGAFSYCTDSDNNIHHFLASTLIVLIN